jgi:ubiquinone/menaquinone biosynthesis C-methylase UbiE
MPDILKIQLMAKTEAFDRYTTEYDFWYDTHKQIYEAECEAVRNFIPAGLNGIEIGAGTGRFSMPFNIRTAIDPAFSMAACLKMKGINSVQAAAEALPFRPCSFDFVLMVTSICFFDDIDAAFHEACRILKKNGLIIIGFIDSESELGIMYKHKKNESRFYKDAVFYSVNEILDSLKNSGFSGFECNQAVFPESSGLQVRWTKGYGTGGFVVIKAVKENNLY